MKGSEDVLVYLHASIIAKLYNAFPTVSPIESNLFWTKFLKLVQSDVYAKNINLGPITFIVNFTESASVTTFSYLESTHLEDFFSKRNQSNILYIDLLGNSFDPSPFSDQNIKNLEDVAESSAANDYLYIFVRGNELKITHKQVIIKDIPDFYSLNRVGHIKALLPIHEYRKLLDKH